MSVPARNGGWNNEGKCWFVELAPGKENDAPTETRAEAAPSVLSSLSRSYGVPEGGRADQSRNLHEKNGQFSGQMYEFRVLAESGSATNHHVKRA